VPAGSVFALLGATGAGKTTAIKILLNLVTASRGRAHALGVDSRSMGPKVLAQIGCCLAKEAIRAPRRE
jgi:ABC-2 type transport system ATP-binding protein